MKPFTVTLFKDKETKNTIRFTSKNEDDHIPTVYISKEAFGEMIPKKIKISVE